MTTRICPNCGSGVESDEEFCPTCGEFVGTEETSTEPSPERFELGSAPPPPESTPPPVEPVPEEPIICSICGTTNPPTNRHCEECGARLSQSPLPSAPRPSVQVTAGVRAVIALGALLVGVFFVVLLFQLFGGDDEDPAAATTTLSEEAQATSTVAPPTTVQTVAPINAANAECDPPGLGDLTCANLIDGDPSTEYQIDYAELADGEPVTITLTFRQPMTVTRIDWYNIPATQEARFRRNLKAQSISVTSDSSPAEVPISLDNVPQAQNLTYSAMSTNRLVISVTAAYPGETVEGEAPFTELAIADITVIGRPAPATGITTGPATTGAGDSAPSTTAGG